MRRGWLFEGRQIVQIVALGVAAAVAYGICQDLVTAHLCVEYFTIGHPNLLGVDPHQASPILQALIWGVLATWWVGAILGLFAAALARVGPRPRLTARDLLRPVGLLMGGTALSALVAGVVGGVLAGTGSITLVGHLAERIPPEAHLWFLVDGWAHGVAYLAAAIGGLSLWGHIVKERLRRARRASLVR